MSENKISLKFIGFEKDGDHVEYKIIVKDSNNETWQLTERYSGLRQMYRELRDILSAENLPDFPPKKYFGTMSDSFITQRQKALENFFNNLLKKHRYDELVPLKELIESKKPEPQKPDQQKTTNTKGANNVPNKDQLINLEKIIGNFKNEFFDLNDTFNPPEEEEIRKKKNKYNFKLEIGPATISYQLPTGSESNLISIQDKTLPSIDTAIAPLMESVLNEIKEGISKINIHSDQPIVVSLD